MRNAFEDHASKGLKVTLLGGCKATYPSMHLTPRSEEVAVQCIEDHALRRFNATNAFKATLQKGCEHSPIPVLARS
jgi:hypothetical protein